MFYLGYNSAASGTYTLSGGAPVAGQEYVGCAGTGTFTHSGGTNNSRYLYLGYFSGASGTYSLSGSGQLSAYLQYVGCYGTGTFGQTGGTNTVSSALYLGMYGGGSGTYNLSGGTLAAQQISGGTGTSTFNFDGGLLQAPGGAASAFMSGLSNAYVKGGGANVDSNGQNITIAQALLDGGSSGGLAKLGSGTLLLSGSNAYSGGTTISAGTLQVGNASAWAVPPAASQSTAARSISTP